MLQTGNLKLSIRDNIVLSDSSVVIAGSHNNPDPAEDFLFVTRMDKNNNIIFNKKIQGFKGYAKNIIECNNGDILVIAYINTNTSQTASLFRLNSNGNIVC